MSQAWPKGTWVQIETVILPSGQRAPQVPIDTQLVPLLMRAKGFLKEPAVIGDSVEVTTVIGRTLPGKLIAANPKANYDFGSPVPELLTVGSELRQRLREQTSGY